MGRSNWHKQSPDSKKQHHPFKFVNSLWKAPSEDSHLSDSQLVINPFMKDNLKLNG